MLYFLKNRFFQNGSQIGTDGTITRPYRRFNAVAIQITVRLLPPSTNDDPVTHF